MHNRKVMEENRVDFLQVYYFLTVCKHMHITNAAGELYISQPALSASIARLEKDLGVSLFHRKGRTISLSDEGMIACRHLGNIWDSYSRLQEDLHQAKETKAQTIKLGSSSHRSLIASMGDFMESNPAISIQQTSAHSTLLKEKLLKGELDLCVSSPPISGEGIHCHVLCIEEILLQVPKGHAIATKENVRLSDCAGENFMGFPKGYTFREICDELFSQAEFKPNYVFELDTPSLLDIRRTSLAAPFFGLFPKSLCGKAFDADGGSVFLSLSFPRCYRTLALSWPSSLPLNHSVRELIEYLKGYYRDQPEVK